jgi:hypothetical protein
MLDAWFNGHEAWPLIRRVIEETPSDPRLYLTPYGEDIYLETCVIDPIERIESILVNGDKSIIAGKESIPIIKGDWFDSMEEGFLLVRVLDHDIHLSCLTLKN